MQTYITTVHQLQINQMRFLKFTNYVHQSLVCTVHSTYGS